MKIEIENIYGVITVLIVLTYIKPGALKKLCGSRLMDQVRKWFTCK
jgi:hypothetical protein